mmetsp:Transcript_10853/g.28698  ORF Transcript_10853/g.28698 Transcript_10853/m.28698 type:complete len:200 (-) Transcript_10853:482-1081(-)
MEGWARHHASAEVCFAQLPQDGQQQPEVSETQAQEFPLRVYEYGLEGKALKDCQGHLRNLEGCQGQVRLRGVLDPETLCERPLQRQQEDHRLCTVQRLRWDGKSARRVNRRALLRELRSAAEERLHSLHRETPDEGPATLLALFDVREQKADALGGKSPLARPHAVDRPELLEADDVRGIVAERRVPGGRPRQATPNLA